MSKIGIFDPYLDDVGGGEKYMLTIAEVLSKENDVSVLWDKKEDLEKAEVRFGLDLSRVKIKRNIFSIKTPAWKRFLASRDYDAIIFLSDGSFPLVRSNLFIHFQRPLEHVSASRLAKFKINKVKSFFVNSEFTKSYIDKTFHINSEVIYPPVELKSKNIKKENIILHVGRFRPFDKTNGSKDYKKQQIMIDVFKEMAEAGLKNWKFILAVSVQEEDKEMFESVKKNAEGYPIQFEINKSNDALWEFYSKAKIYWHASGFGEDLERHPEFAEHFGISTVEAMGAGAVPVVINAGGQKEIVEGGKNGLLWETLEELKKKTLKLIGAPKLMLELSKNAETRAKDFSKEEFEKKILEIIN